MILKKLYINQFRNYKETMFTFSDNVNVLYGENGTGKTNILEAIYLLGRGISFRTRHEKELVNHNIDYTNGEKGYYIKAVFKSDHNEYDTTVEISYKLEGKKHTKHVFINKKEIKARRDLIGKLIFVLFLPTDTNLIEGSPSIRRDFFHMLISMVSNEYLDTLIKYNKILKMRNKLLSIKSNDFYIYDDDLSKYAMIIKEKNIEYTLILEKTMNDIHKKIFDENTDIYSIKLKNCLSDINTVEQYIEKLKSTTQEQIRLGTTYFGIHRAEYDIYYNNMQAKKYCSQGQKRICSLIMKLAEEHIVSQARKESTLLLIDDALLELDNNKRTKVLEYIEKKGQVFITVTEKENILINNKHEYNILESQRCDHL